MSDRDNKDLKLVARLLAGEETAFDFFFETYFPRLYRFALTRLGWDEDSAEEVVQTTLIKAIQKLGTYRGEAALFTWLCTFCRHEMSAYYKRNHRLRESHPLLEDLPEVRAALDSLARAQPESDDPERATQRNEVARLVQVTLDHLPPRYGDALEWKYIEGLSVKEIAARLELGPKAAESLLTRARQAFRDGFETILRAPMKEAFP